MKVIRSTKSSICGDDGKYYDFKRCPYNLPEYYSISKNHDKFKEDYFEYVIRHMSDSLIWIEKNIKPISKLTFEHDYYEIVEYRKGLLADYSAKYPDAYGTFLREHPSVIDYEEYKQV